MTWPGGDEDAQPLPAPRIRPYLHGQPPAVDTGKTATETTLASTPPTPRPFVLTAGRVEIDPKIGLETQVTARPEASVWTSPTLSRLPPELQEIVALCQTPISVAEISARLRLHLGVTRVLVSDLHHAGHLDIHAGVTDANNPDLILRVIHGLRALT